MSPVRSCLRQIGTLVLASQHFKGYCWVFGAWQDILHVIILFELPKTLSHSADMAGIDRVSKTHWESVGKMVLASWLTVWSIWRKCFPLKVWVSGLSCGVELWEMLSDQKTRMMRVSRIMDHNPMTYLGIHDIWAGLLESLRD